MIVAFLVYQLVAVLVFVLALPFVLLRLALHPAEMRERLGMANGNGASEPLAHAGRARSIWLHAASLGEVEALRSFVEAVAPELREEAIVTVTSVSARRQAPGRLNGLPVSYAPLDFWFALGPFLGRVQPRGLVLFETELWPTLLTLCARRQVPVLLLSARVSDRNRLRHPALRWLLSPFTRSIVAAGAQRDVDARRLRALGVRNVHVTGNLKYRLAPIRPAPPDPSLPFLWTAGSVRRGEERIFETVRNAPGRAVIAPRHLRETEAWERAARARSVALVRRSSLSGDPTTILAHWPESAEALLLDTHGELREWYRLSSAAFVGGTWVPIGGHNLFEPAGLGCPVAFGPRHEAVADAADLLIAHAGGICAESPAVLSQWLVRLAENADLRASAREGAFRAAEELASGVSETRKYLEREPACRWLALPTT